MRYHPPVEVGRYKVYCSAGVWVVRDTAQRGRAGEVAHCPTKREAMAVARNMEAA